MTIRSHVLVATVATVAAVLLLGGPAAAQEVKAEEHVLPNGMKLLLVHRPDEPSVSAGWVAKVGSVNERVGITGISHLFEHMMFKGTTTLGSKDPKRDLEIIGEQEKLRDEMRAEESKMRAAWRRGEVDDITKPESKTPRYKELEVKFDALVKEQRDLLVKNEFDRIYTKNGASGMNAFTTNDLTAYFITVPKNKLELWFWMESDRLKDPVFREFYAERDVVYEERRLRVESTPTGKLDEAFESIFWHSTPYTWPVIGYASDVANITKAQADDYFATYYAPNNLTAVLVGAFDRAEALRLANEYFGRIPRGKVAPPEVVTLPTKWQYDLRFEGEADTNPTAEIRWHTVPFQHKDSYALSVLAELLNGRTGRLYKSMVLPSDAVATQASASHNSFGAPGKYAGSFTVRRRGQGREDAGRGRSKGPRRDRAPEEGARPRRRAPEGEEQHRGGIVPPALLELPDPRPADGQRGLRRLAGDEHRAEEARGGHGRRRPAGCADLSREGEPGDGARLSQGGLGPVGRRRRPRGRPGADPPDDQAVAGAPRRRNRCRQAEGRHREDGSPVGPGAPRDEEGFRPARREGEGAPRRARDGREEVRSGE
ncbi:MAG: insulinase family protein [Holophagales bacterium]|nr:insulinase family protein [Holophagales bacterium]